MGGVAPTVGLRQAAEELGVHYMTAYRYVRSGRLPAHKSGAEWQIDPADLARLGAASARRIPPRGRAAPRSVHRARLEARLVAGDEAGAWGVVDAALASGAAPADVLSVLLAPALRSIGERWERGELSVADEHRASAVAQRLVARLGPRFARPGRRRGRVVIGSAAGDRHTLPTAILSDLLRGAGLEVTDLGADCPADTFADAVRLADSPAAVGICVSSDDVLGSVPRLIAEVRACGVRCPIVLGGGAIDDAGTAATLGADRWAGPIDEVVDLFVELAAGVDQGDASDAPGVGE